MTDARLSRRTIGFVAGALLTVAAATGCGSPEQAASPTPSGSATVAETPGTPTAEATTTPTPPPGLTDTGYLAPDGRPLYKECIQANAPAPLPLPPVYPTPSGPIEYPPTPAVLNLGPTPAPAELPSFDPLALAPASTAGWVTYTSKCFGFSVSYPPDWVVSSPFTVGGYQQGEDGILKSADGKAKVEIHLVTTEADEIRLAAASGGRSDVYLLQKPVTGTWKGKASVTLYSFIYAPPPSVVLSRVVSLGSSKYMFVSFELLPPFDLKTADAAAGVLESIVLP